jgi:hypothetical protein
MTLTILPFLVNWHRKLSSFSVVFAGNFTHTIAARYNCFSSRRCPLHSTSNLGLAVSPILQKTSRRAMIEPLAAQWSSGAVLLALPAVVYQAACDLVAVGLGELIHIFPDGVDEYIGDGDALAV